MCPGDDFAGQAREKARQQGDHQAFAEQDHGKGQQPFPLVNFLGLGFCCFHLPKLRATKDRTSSPLWKEKDESFSKNVHQEITYHASLRLAKKAKITSSWRLVKDRPKTQNSTSHIWRFRSCLLWPSVASSC